MDKKIVAFSTLMLIVGFAIGYVASYVGSVEQISDLRNQVSTLQMEKSSLQNEVVSLQNQRANQILGLYFSPKGGCEEQIIYWIDKANSSIHVLIYSFTLDSISNALINAYSRGIEVEVLFEKSEISQYSEYQKLKSIGISVRNDTNSKLMHNKIMIVDNLIIATGSYNWSANAEESNNENMIVIRSPDIANTYEEEFTNIWNNGI